MPVTSMVQLARIDFQTSDPAQLRAAVKLPATLQPLPRGIALRIKVTAGSAPAEQRDFMLREIPLPAELTREASADTRIFAYRLDDADVPRLIAFRNEQLAKKREGSSRGLSISVVPHACKTSELADGPILFTTYLRTAETIDYVPLARDVDLKTLVPGRDIAAEIPLCNS
jgi:hypothetical protein